MSRKNHRNRNRNNNPLNNNLIYTTFIKYSPKYKYMCQKFLDEDADILTHEHSDLRFDKISSTLSCAYNSSTQNVVFSLNACITFQLVHLSVQINSNVQYAPDQLVQAQIEQENNIEQVVILEPDSEKISFDDFMSIHLSEMCETILSKIFKDYENRCSTVSDAQKLYNSFLNAGAKFSDPDNALGKYYVNKYFDKVKDKLSDLVFNMCKDKIVYDYPHYYSENALAAAVKFLNLSVGTDNGAISMALQLNISYGDVFNDNKTYCSSCQSFLYILLLNDTNNAELHSLLDKELRSFIMKVSQKAAKSIIAYILPMNALSEKQRRYLTLDNEQREYISGVFGRKPLNDEEAFITLDSSAAVFKGSPIKKSSRFYTLPDDFFKPQQDDSYSLLSKDYPENDFELIDFLDQADALYREINKEGLAAKPLLTFSIEKDSLMSCRTKDKRKYELCADGIHSMMELLNILYDQILSDAVKDMDLDSEYLEAFNDARLNSLDIAVLKHVYTSNGTWKSETMQCLNDEFPASSDAYEKSFGKLCNLVVRDTEPPETAVNYEWKSTRKHGSFLYYTCGIKCSAELFDKIHAVPFSDKDLSKFHRSFQEQIITQMCLDSKTPEERWKALQRLEKLPKTCTQRFIQTEEGAEFFRKFEGNDRTYAAFMLENCNSTLCRHLSKELLDE